MPILDRLSKTPGWLVLSLGFILVGIIGLLDYATGYEISFSIFYLIPIAWVSWQVGGRAGFLLSWVSALVWLAIDLAGGHVFSRPWIPYWNAGVRLAFFLITSALAHRLKISQEGIQRAKEGLEQQVEARTASLRVAAEQLQHELADRTRAEQALQKSEERYRSLFEKSPQPMWVYDTDTLQFLDVNEAAVEHYGYSREDFLSMTLKDIRPPEEIQRLMENLSRSRGPSMEHSGAWKHRTRDGTLIDVEVHSHGVEWGGRPARLVLVSDVTTRTRAQEALRDSEERFWSLVENATVGIYRTTPDGRILTANPALVRMLGFDSFEELASRNLESNGFAPGYPRSVFRERVEREGTVSGIVSAWTRRDGTVIFVRESAGVVRGDEGRVLYYDGVVEDITERKRVEAALQASEEKFRGIFDGAPIGIYQSTPDGKFITVNQALADILGYSSREELMQCDMARDVYFDPAQRAALIAEYVKFGSVAGLEIRWKKKNGSPIWIQLNARANKDTTGKTISFDGFVRDVTERKQAEDALRNSEQIYREAIENASGVPFRLIFGESLGAGIYDHVGDGITDLLGLPATEFTEKSFQEMVKEVVPLSSAIPLDPEECRRAMLDGKIRQYRADVRVRTASGEEKWLQDTSLPLRDEHTGQIIGALGILMDITERKRAEQLQWAVYRIAEAASRSGSLDDLYQAVHQIVGDVMPAHNFYIARFDEENDLLSFPYFVDEADSAPAPRRPGKELTSYVLFRGRSLLCTPEVDRELTERGEVDCIGSPSAVWLGVPLRVADKTIGVMTVQDYANPAAYGVREQQMLEYVSSHVAEAIERKRAEDALRESEIRYRLMVEGSEQVFFYIHDPQHCFEYVSPSVKNVLGYDPKELLGQPYDVLLTGLPDDAIVQEMTDGALRDGQRRPAYTVAHRHKDGRVIALEIVESPVEQDGRVVGIQGFARDITEWKRAEQLQSVVYRIAQATNQATSLDDVYRAVHQIIGEVMPAGNFFIAQYDEQNNLLSFPYFVDEIDVAPASPCKPGKELTSYILRTGKSLLCTAEVDQELRARGEVEVVSAPSAVWLGVPLRMADKTIGVMAVQDYSNPTAYGEREQRILEYVSSEVAKAIERKRAEQALQQSEAQYRELVENAASAIFRATLDGRFLEVNPALVEMLGYDSKEELLQRNLAPDIYRRPGDREALIQRISESGVVQSVEVEWVRKDGQFITVSLSGRALKDKLGNIVCIESIAENVSERRLLEDQLRQAQKMEAVGRLAGGVAHDFNNLLMVITGYGELLRDRLQASDPSVKNLDEILKASERAAALTRQLLAFSRRQVLEPRVLSLNDVVADVEKMLRRLIGEDVELVTRLAPHLGTVRADPGQLEQVLMNLAVNARDAMPRGGRLVIQTSNIEVDDDFARRHLGLQAGSWVTCVVSDTGAGMDADTRAHIFEPFFTTKEKGKGTGLGLATVYGIVKQSGGYVGVYSEKDQGTTFTVYLPRVDQMAQPAAGTGTVSAATGGTETILLVEDEAGVRELGIEILRSKGYTVLAATNAEQALRLAREHTGPVHLLLTDLVLPGISGRELAEQLSTQQPKTKVVYMSGYTEDTFLHQVGLPPSTAFLQKPFSPALLARKIRETLDAP